MQEQARDPGVRLVGREPEFAELRESLKADRGRTALLLTGGPGIGKTTLWEATAAAARAQGQRVLSARPSGAEAQLAFAALTDLLHDVDFDALAGLPAPQRQALEVALLRVKPGDVAPEPHAIALGFLNALRSLAAEKAVLVAVDDVQWLDAPSETALVYAARRLEGTNVGFLLAKRSGGDSKLEQALELSLQRLQVGPLTLGAIRHLLFERLALSLPRPVLRRVFESAQGNPLFAMEIGRALLELGLPEPGEDIPVSDAVQAQLGIRVAALPAPVRRLLLAVALSAGLRVSQLAALGEAAALDDALDAGVLVADGERVRASHPLLAAAAKRHSRAGERRELHLELARVVVDEELRARHLALATVRPDAELGATVAAAARAASARGAVQDAMELAEHALRLTPPESPGHADLLLLLAAYMVVAGEGQRVTDLLAPQLGSFPPGRLRVTALLLLTGGEVSGNDEIGRYLEQALAASGSDPGLRAAVLAQLAENAAIIRVERIPEAEAWAREALAAAELAGPDTESRALNALSWSQSLRGRPIDELCDRFRVSFSTAYLAVSPERVAGQRLVWRGEVDQARVLLTRLLAVADDRGEPYAYALQRLHVCELELRMGGWAAASSLLDEWAESADRELVIWPMYERCRALLAAGRGLHADAERWAKEAIVRAEATGVRWDLLEALRARGIAALLAHEPERAANDLRFIWEHMQREGVEEPGVFPVAPDLVEALVELGELEEAREVTGRLSRLGEGQNHPWARISARRCSALVRLAEGYDDHAAESLAEAATAYEQLGLRFDSARSLLSLGRAQRRLRKWGAARRSLEQAADAFDAIGSGGWTEQVHSELARVGARRPRPAGELTPAEQRVVELAVEGRSNKEIAQALFVAVHTVEVHLSHAYRKLGVRSRSQLRGRLSRTIPG